MAMSLQSGTILRVNPVGLADAEDTKSKEIYSFTFDKIEGYRGQSVEELGLISGSRVAFSSLDGVVRSVRIRHTTFSSFEYEAYTTSRTESAWLELVYAVASLVLGYVAVWLGVSLVRRQQFHTA